ncbi:MAG TPA: hypothetical protein VF894_11015 [Anaeromyxobacter sp.]
MSARDQEAATVHQGGIKTGTQRLVTTGDSDHLLRLDRADIVRRASTHRTHVIVTSGCKVADAMSHALAPFLDVFLMRSRPALSVP